MFALGNRSLSRTWNVGFLAFRTISNAFLGDELQKDLKQLYLLVHPDVMSAFPESVKETNKNSLQVLNRFLEDIKPLCNAASGSPIVPLLEQNLYKLKFVAKSKEFPNDIKKARTVVYDIFVPPYLLSGTMTGPIFRKRWMEFVSRNLVNLFQKCGVISSSEKQRMSKAEVYRLWDGRIETLLSVDKNVIRELQKEAIRESSKHPIGSMTNNEEERNLYLAAKYKERLEHMVNEKLIIPDGLSESETHYGMDRLIRSLMLNATEYQLESPLWQYVVVHLRKGDFQGIQKPGSDKHFHVYVPYMFEEDQLVDFMQSCIKQLQLIAESKKSTKLIE